MARKKLIGSGKEVSVSPDAQEVTRYFYLNDISLWDCSLTRDKEFRWGDHAPEKCITQTFRFVKPQMIEALLEGEADSQLMLRALVKLGLRVILKDDQDQEPIYTLEATFCADYFLLSTPSENMLRSFVDFNCVHNVWPFWRQHVFDTLKRASLPVPSVPLFAGKSKYRRKKVNVVKVIDSGE